MVQMTLCDECRDIIPELVSMMNKADKTLMADSIIADLDAILPFVQEYFHEYLKEGYLDGEKCCVTVPKEKIQDKVINGILFTEDHIRKAILIAGIEMFSEIGD